jgi:hypothetical protein
LSGPKDCLGSMKEARILPVFLHSPIDHQRFGQNVAVRWRDLLFMEEGSGLLMSGILGDWCGGRLRNWRYDDEQNGTRREQHTSSHGMEKRSRRTGAEIGTRMKVGL